MKGNKFPVLVLIMLIGTLTILAQPDFFSCIPITTNGTSSLWYVTFGGVNDDFAHSVVEVRSGGYAIVGGTMSFGVGNLDMWLVRTNAAGNMLWNRTYGGVDGDIGTSIIECSDGGFAIAGYTRSFPRIRQNLWLVRTDAFGNRLWNYSFGGYDTDYGLAVIEVSSGGFAVLGATRSYGSVDPQTQIHTYDWWLIRTDAQGNMLWNQTYGGSGDDIARSIIETADGGFVITGEINGQYRALGMDDIFTYESDAWLLKVDAFGQQLWNRTYGGEDNDFTRSISILPDGNIGLAGFTRSFGAGSYDGWFIQTNETGSSTWSTTYGSPSHEYFRSLIPCSTDGFAFAGYAFDPAGISANLWLVRIDTNGNYLWAHTFGGIEDEIIRQGIRTDGGFACVGYTYSFGAGARDLLLVWVPDSPPAPTFHPVTGLALLLVVILIIVGISVVIWFLRKRK